MNNSIMHESFNIKCIVAASVTLHVGNCLFICFVQHIKACLLSNLSAFLFLVIVKSFVLFNAQCHLSPVCLAGIHDEWVETLPTKTRVRQYFNIFPVWQN